MEEASGTNNSNNNAHKKKKPQPQNKQDRTPSKDHVFRKRKPTKPQEGESVIYVSTKTSSAALLERCNKLIAKGETEVTLYCLGAAIQRGILIALKLCEEHVTFKVHTNTLTTELIDDLEPAADDADYALQRRFNSALKIRVFQTDPLQQQ